VWLFVIAQALLLPNWSAGFGGLIPFTFLYFLRVGKEERLMLEEFGDEYAEYRKGTGRLFPKL
jgi:protein-S-isoprenylcysteine O-methyltransferase Ste14